MARRLAGQALKEAREVGRVRKAQAVGDLADRQRRVAQFALGFEQQTLVQQGQRTAAQLALAKAVELGGRDAQGLGQRGDAGLLAVAALDLSAVAGQVLQAAAVAWSLRGRGGRLQPHHRQHQPRDGAVQRQASPGRRGAGVLLRQPMGGLQQLSRAGTVLFKR
ncbi:MAG: hypothetical protein C0423_10380 [Methylibium sp.]|nr:hypothetical protein [Methylibium sp.]